MRWVSELGGRILSPNYAGENRQQDAGMDSPYPLGEGHLGTGPAGCQVRSGVRLTASLGMTLLMSAGIHPVATLTHIDVPEEDGACVAACRGHGSDRADNEMSDTSEDK